MKEKQQLSAAEDEYRKLKIMANAGVKRLKVYQKICDARLEMVKEIRAMLHELLYLEKGEEITDNIADRIEKTKEKK